MSIPLPLCQTRFLFIVFFLIQLPRTERRCPVRLLGYRNEGGGRPKARAPHPSCVEAFFVIPLLGSSGPWNRLIRKKRAGPGSEKAWHMIRNLGTPPQKPFFKNRTPFPEGNTDVSGSLVCRRRVARFRCLRHATGYSKCRPVFSRRTCF